ncbi:hypothetical protein DFQ30_010214 [Apophysomyces sp. BC1015]|nr:hypothetical protein DFQ30_010214 [Apophysomyces sp. BC1015]
MCSSFVGIATHYVPSSRLPALEDRLADLETSDHSVIQRVIEEFVEPVDVNKIGCLKTERETIDRCFRYNTVDEILEALDREKSTTWIRETKRQLLSVSPTSLRVILRLLRKAESMSLRECLEMEFDLIQKFMVTKDFHEGVDAMFLSKPRRKPHWEPSTLAEISEDDIDHLYFNYPSPNALTLPTKLDLKTRYPYSRFALPSEEDVRLAIIGNGPEFGPEHRLTNDQDVLTWFMQGYRGKWGVQEKILDILQRKTHHPDKRGSTSDDADYAHRILQAWEVLRDPVKRQHYDLELKTDQLSQPTINAEIDLDEMDYDESSQTYTVECRCSGLYSITENDLEQGVDVVNCDLCSLRIRVLYDVVDE